MADPRRDRALRITAAMIPTLLVAIYASHLLARWLPLSAEGKWALGFYLPLPIYAVLACLVVRMRRGPRAWIVITVALGALKVALLLS